MLTDVHTVHTVHTLQYILYILHTLCRAVPHRTVPYRYIARATSTNISDVAYSLLCHMFANITMPGNPLCVLVNWLMQLLLLRNSNMSPAVLPVVIRMHTEHGKHSTASKARTPRAASTASAASIARTSTANKQAKQASKQTSTDSK